MSNEPRIVELTEYRPRLLPEGEFTEAFARLLHTSYGKQVTVEPPSFLNDRHWKLTSEGWVGYVPLADSLHLSLVPKVEIGNIFRMLEYAYRLDFTILKGLQDAESIVDLYERLAVVLAKRALERIRKGLYRTYVSTEDSLPYVRGRVDLRAHLRRPLGGSLPCRFEEHTADVEDNRILLWTLTKILSSGVCSEACLPHVRQARRALLSIAAVEPLAAKSCVDRLYNRLNDDYASMHALCRFFLEHTGPTHRRGDRRMLPILVDMARLFELFVVEWLRAHAPSCYTVRSQENVQFKMGEIVSINIDITIEDVRTGETAFVLDTKYKVPDQPAASDIEQVVAYAEAKNCRSAVLIYPACIQKAIKGKWGRDIHVQSMTFNLGGDLEAAGQEFLGQLLKPEGNASL